MTQKLYQTEKLITFMSGSRLIWIENDNSDHDLLEIRNEDAITHLSPFRSIQWNEHNEYMDDGKHFDIIKSTVVSYFTQIKKQNPNFILPLLSAPHSIEPNGMWFLKQKAKLIDTEIAYKSFFWACKGLRKEIDKFKSSEEKHDKAIGKLYSHYISMLIGLKSIILGRLECFPLKQDTQEYEILMQAKENYNETFAEILDEYIAKIERFINLSIQEGNYKKYSLDIGMIEHYIRSVTFYG